MAVIHSWLRYLRRTRCIEKLLAEPARMLPVTISARPDSDGGALVGVTKHSCSGVGDDPFGSARDVTTT